MKHFNNLNFIKKILVLPGVAVLFFIVIMMTLSFLYEKQNKNFSKFKMVELKRGDVFSELYSDISIISGKLNKLLLDSGRGLSEEEIYEAGILLLDQLEEIRSEIDNTRKAYYLSKAENVLINHLAINIDKYRALATTAIEHSTVNPELANLRVLESYDSYLDLNKRFSDFLTHVRNDHFNVISQIQSDNKTSLTILLVSLIFFLSGLIFLSILISRKIEKPVSHLHGMILDILNSNNYQLRSTLSGKDEIGVLSSGINKLLDQIHVREEEINDQRVAYQSIIESAADAVVQVNDQSCIEIFNDAAENIFGYERKDIIGKHVSVLIPQKAVNLNDSCMSDYLNSVKKNLRKNGHQIIALKKDGSVFPAHLSIGEHIYKGEKKCTGILKDLSDLHRAQEMIKKSKEYSDSIISSLGDLLLVTDAYGVIEFANEKAIKFLGNKNKITGLDISYILHREYEKSFEQIVFSWFKDSSRIIEQESMCYPLCGEGIPVLVNGKRINKAADARYVFLLKDQRDSRLLTELRKAQERLVTSSKMAALGEMAGGIAHEINNPLAAIMLRAHQGKRLLGKEDFDTEMIRNFLNTIEDCGDRIKKIIEGLRFFSGSGEQDKFEKVSLYQLVQDAVSLCSEKFLHDHIELRLADIPLCLEAECRPVQIGQLILHLVQNAYSEVKQLDAERKWVALSLEDQGLQIKISVVDGGPGVPEEIRSKLFQPFFTTRDIGEGTGLGLSVSKGIAESHGGSLYLDETKAHTTFVLTLPKAQNTAAATVF
ncbi:MAG: PAS domain S-box protein [Deltaproteobacteria bacterium]|nr:PAS domain S-box protein [Deltaproteobacteria bacterium]